MPLYKALYCAYTGLSPVMAQEICFRAGLDGDLPANAQEPETLNRLFETFLTLLKQIIDGDFAPNIIYEMLSHNFNNKCFLTEIT